MLHFYTPKTSEYQSFLITSGGIKMENWLKNRLILDTNVVANPIKQMFHHFNTPYRHGKI